MNALLLTVLIAPAAPPAWQVSVAEPPSYQVSAAAPGPPRYDTRMLGPWRDYAADWDWLRGVVLLGRPAVAALGVPFPTEYVEGAAFPAGFLGWPDGVYDCYLGPGGVPTARLRTTPAAGTRGSLPPADASTVRSRPTPAAAGWTRQPAAGVPAAAPFTVGGRDTGVPSAGPTTYRPGFNSAPAPSGERTGTRIAIPAGTTDDCST